MKHKSCDKPAWKEPVFHIYRAVVQEIRPSKNNRHTKQQQKPNKDRKGQNSITQKMCTATGGQGNINLTLRVNNEDVRGSEVRLWKKMEMSGQLHAQPALSQRRSSVPIGKEAGFAPEPVWTL
jgi:hypothetical protein